MQFKITQQELVCQRTNLVNYTYLLKTETTQQFTKVTKSWNPIQWTKTSNYYSWSRYYHNHKRKQFT